jgi:hypothetical protein
LAGYCCVEGAHRPGGDTIWEAVAGYPIQQEAKCVWLGHLCKELGAVLVELDLQEGTQQVPIR